MTKFDLEQAIEDWRTDLRRNPALEDGQAAELEAGLRDEVEELVSGGADVETAFRKAVAAMGPAADSGREFYKAKRTRRSSRPPWQPPRFVPALVWSYFQVALRKIRRQKGYAFINIAGLAVGLACSILMMLWISETAVAYPYWPLLNPRSIIYVSRISESRMFPGVLRR